MFALGWRAEEVQDRGLLIGGGADSVGSNVSNYLTENRYDAAEAPSSR